LFEGDRVSLRVTAERQMVERPWGKLMTGGG